jgi:hypothetical protein
VKTINKLIMRLKWLFLLLILTAFISCEKEKSIKFTLYLNYDSSINECRTFKVSIDDQQKFNGEVCFNFHTGSEIIEFQIEPGLHKIKAEVSGVIDIFQQSVDFDNEKPYGYLTFDQETSEFNFFLKSGGGLD